MKRSEALQPLSHDHHQALFLAMRMSRVEPDSADEIADAFLTFWREHGQRHFREEEEVLFPVYAEHAEIDEALVGRVLVDHAVIRGAARRLESGADGAADPEALRALGQTLSDHVRREERELFPLIEEAIPESASEYLVEVLVGSENERRKAKESPES